jgi:hypothetical protein
MTSKQLFLTIFFWNKWIKPLHKGDKKKDGIEAEGNTLSTAE